MPRSKSKSVCCMYVKYLLINHAAYGLQLLKAAFPKSKKLQSTNVCRDGDNLNKEQIILKITNLLTILKQICYKIFHRFLSHHSLCQCVQVLVLKK
ncbi:hypothetical protein XELAEV_18029321mg [Xenopus laevis]|uniref:Uncharacterized protein n=1 Tax=Xenopus laevis TaxID=8355 RepID=A0A974HHI2_XENLA|nr:hypothetical protein XELAEV_18029321mg [Xenopus laevis]